MIYPGTQFGPYYIDRELGRGGMAVVYHAVDERTGAEVALKVLPADAAHNHALLRRFSQECELALRLRHPNIVRAYESDEIDGTPFIALHFAPKGTLASLLNQRPEPIPLEETVQILRRVALALDYAHSRNVLHRDVKPSNILIGPSGQIWLADFGLAKRMDEEATQFTTSSRTIGTPAYMSPEQIEQNSEIDARADIYSLGVVAYSMLSGGMPFEASSQISLLKKIAYDPPISPGSHNQQLSQGTSYVLERVLAKDPALRYRTASEFIDALTESPALLPSSADWAAIQGERKAPNKRTDNKKEKPDPAQNTASKQLRNGWNAYLVHSLRQPLGWLIVLASAVALLLAFQLLSGQGTSEAMSADNVSLSPSPSPIESATALSPAAARVDDENVDATETESSTLSRPVIIPASPTLIPEETSTLVQIATQTKTATPLVTPTRAATAEKVSNVEGSQQGEKSPTSTPVPDLPATRTPTPRPTPTSTSTRSLLPTKPPVKEDGDALPLPPALAVQLVFPDEGANIQGKSSFSWHTEDKLPAGYAFEPVFWQPGQDPLRDGRGWGGSTTANALTIDPTKYLPSGVYFWGVRLVETNPFKPVKLISSQRGLLIEAQGQPLDAKDVGKLPGATATPRSYPYRVGGRK